MPHRPTRIRRSIAAGVSALALLAAPAGSARAQGAGDLLPIASPFAASPNEQGLVQFLLPYAPTIFDVVVSLSRSVVALTYETRGLDPVTGDFVVTGLKLERGAFKASADRIRFNASTSIYEGLSLDTRTLPLEPPLREALRRLGSEVIQGDIVSQITGDAPSASYDFNITADFAKIGRIALSAQVKGFHILVPLFGADAELVAEGVGPNDAPVLAGDLVGARIVFDDAGIAATAIALASQTQSMTENEMQSMLAKTVRPLVESLFNELPGGASPALKAKSAAWAATLQAFLADPKHLEISLAPSAPVPLRALQEGVVTAATIEALNPDVSRDRVEAPLFDPDALLASGAPDLQSARRLIEGVGVPQDIRGGLAIALPKAIAGDAEAATLAVRGIVLDPAAAAAADTNGDAYTLLLLARPKGESVPDAVLAAFEAVLPVAMLDTAADRAQNIWFTTPEGASRRDEAVDAFTARDWAGVRKLAFDLYDGRHIPRNLKQAFVGATLAAAGGDRIAAKLRDDLRRAASARTVRFGIDATDADLKSIWKQVLATPAAAAGGATPDAGAIAPPPVVTPPVLTPPTAPAPAPDAAP